MSQIATTIEQSKRLLDAGLDPGSADMQWNAVPYRNGKSAIELFVGDVTPNGVPAWSLSRLWDAFGLDVLGGWFSVGSSRSEDVIEELVRMLENRYANH